MITMLLGGLWHGASWNFVIWGALHGAASRGDPHVAARAQASRSLTTRAWASVSSGPSSTFQFVCVAWVFFRAPTFGHATLLLGRIARLTGGTANVSPRVVLVLAAGLLLHGVPAGWADRLRERFVRTPAVAQGVLLAAAAYALHLAAGAKTEPFVYGQF